MIELYKQLKIRFCQTYKISVVLNRKMILQLWQLRVAKVKLKKNGNEVGPTRET